MRAKLYTLSLSTLVILFASSCSDYPTLPTVVEGTVKHKYTGQPVDGIAVQVVQSTPRGLFMPPAQDSVTAARTDANGHYSLSFTPADKSSYALLAPYNPTYYPLGVSEYGLPIKAGVHNTLNFDVTTYKTVTIKANTTKQGKTDIDFYFISEGENSGVGDFNGSIFSDTVKANQAIAFTTTVKVLPNRVYRFYKATQTRVRQVNGYNYTFKDYAFTMQTRPISFLNDTATVVFR